MKRLIRRRFWGRTWAVLVAAAALLAAVLGPWGYREYLTANRKTTSAADLAYRTLQLFFLNGESLDPPVPVPLHEARFLAAFVALSTVIAALLQLFHTRVHLLRARLNRGHVVVCGLHPRRLGLVEALRRNREKVVVLMPEAHAEGVARCRYAGAVVVTGYAIDGWLLGRVHLRRAKALLALSPDDETNIRAALLARQVPRRPEDDPLKCVVEVSDVDLRQQLAQLNFGGWADNPFDLELITPFDIAAHVLWAEAIRLCGDRMPRRLLVVGLGRLGEALVLRAAREWLLEEDRGTTPRIAIVDREAPQRERHLRDAHSFVGRTCELAWLTVDVQDSAFARGLPGLCDGTDVVDAAFVCLENEVSGLLAALVLSKEPKLKETPTLLQISGTDSLAMMIEHGERGRIHPVAMEEIYESPNLVLDATCEVLARVIHEHYLWNERKRRTFKVDKPSHRPWPDLNEQYRNSNRGQARDIPNKLSLLGYRLVPAPGIGSPSDPASDEGTPFQFSAEEVERLAEREHARWRGEVQNHPADVPWDQLDEQNRNRDRDAVREIPALVARAGLGIVPRPQTGGAPGQVAAAEPSPTQPECLVAPS
jgi:hypothetical protein